MGVPPEVHTERELSGRVYMLYHKLVLKLQNSCSLNHIVRCRFSPTFADECLNMPSHHGFLGKGKFSQSGEGAFARCSEVAKLLRELLAKHNLNTIFINMFHSLS